MLDGERNAGVVDARRRYDELRLAHEAATAELASRREALRVAEAQRASRPDAYHQTLATTREQRDRVLNLVGQVKRAGAVLTLVEAQAQGSRS